MRMIHQIKGFTIKLARFKVKLIVQRVGNSLADELADELGDL